jgi:hypothetical protein
MTPEDSSGLHKDLDDLKHIIWTRRPILGEIMRRHGNTILHDYAQDFLDVNECPRLDTRKDELITAAQQLISERLGDDVANRVARQLRRLPLVSTTDHHGPIDHPFFVNANIISAIPIMERADPELQSLVVFSFASVSLNNASAYPRGVLFHAGERGEGPLVRLPILPDKVKMSVVYGQAPYSRGELARAETELARRTTNGEISPKRAERIHTMLEKIFGADDIFAAPDLATQITMINHRLWPHLFHPTHNHTQKPAPELVYLDIESLVTKLMLDRHLDPASVFHSVLFNPELRGRALQTFNNLPGAYSLEHDWGTFFFWGRDEKGHRVRLLLGEDSLVAPNAKLEIALTPESIRQALLERRIFPSMLLCYLMVALHYGMKCLGGFSQVHDLTMIKDAWADFLTQYGRGDEAAALDPVQTKELSGDGMVLAYITTQQGDLTPATGVDMALMESDTSLEHYAELSRRVTLAQMMEPMLPEIYSVLYTGAERDVRLAQIPAEKIVAATNLYETLEHEQPHTAPPHVADEPEELMDVSALQPIPVRHDK